MYNEIRGELVPNEGETTPERKREENKEGKTGDDADAEADHRRYPECGVLARPKETECGNAERQYSTVCEDRCYNDRNVNPVTLCEMWERINTIQVKRGSGGYPQGRNHKRESGSVHRL
jgi:hypothetical protein